MEPVHNPLPGTIRGVAAVYNRHSYAEEKRLALEAWSDFVMKLVGATKLSDEWADHVDDRRAKR